MPRRLFKPGAENWPKKLSVAIDVNINKTVLEGCSQSPGIVAKVFTNPTLRHLLRADILFMCFIVCFSLICLRVCVFVSVSLSLRVSCIEEACFFSDSAFDNVEIGNG